uniref:FXYD domain-containing ion transport regulator n=1 Tax=Chanos chanos TaxID=29144 RepID=A0A6S4IR45_CHACN|nr:FXYD11 [Chanos chanos]
MRQFAALILLAVFCTFFCEAEANPFYYNYDRLRIGGLVFAGLLVGGGVGILVWNKCKSKNKKGDDASEI